MEQSLEHLITKETLAALGAWDGLERRVEFVGCALRILAQLYPNGISARAKKRQKR
jgi:hypothetical protein